MTKIIPTLLLMISFAGFGLKSVAAATGDASKEDVITIENTDMRLLIGTNGQALSLVSKPDNRECLFTDVRVPAFSLTQCRPYDNELQLKYPANPKTFPANSVRMENDRLIIGFDLINIIATVRVKITESYIAFTLEKLDYRIPEFGDKRKTPVDELVLLQLPVKDSENFGEWLNVVWDEKVAVNLLGADPYVRIDARTEPGYHLLRATAVSEVKPSGTTAALITTGKENLMNCIDQLEQDYDLPRGVQSRRSEAYKYSYYETWDATPQNIDEHIAFAKQAGFRAIQVVWTAFASSIGHFAWNDAYPNGMKDLQTVVRKIKDAGLIAGAHFWYNKAMKTDPYVTPVPDYRLNLRKIFTLASPLNDTETTVEVEENPAGCTMDDERRILKTGKELIEYSGYTTEPPYRFTGCRRGALNTSPASYEAGHIFGLLDVDTWPLWVRFDQRTSIQQEVAERIGKIYREAGFDFVYFDGAEDVPPPYWFNVGMSQYKVYRQLGSDPAFSEGALKSHFNWHILTRGNAFDVFRPEVMKEAVVKHPMDEIQFIQQDFTSIDFGWIDYVTPGDNTIGIQPDMLEFVCSRAAAWDCPVSLEGKLEALRSHPRTSDNLAVIRRWEKARINGFLTREQKKAMRSTSQEHLLLTDEKGRLEWHPCNQIVNVAGGDPHIRAFLFERAGKNWVVFWHTSGEANLELGIPKNDIHLFRMLGKERHVSRNGKGIMVPVGDRQFMETSLNRSQVIAAFKNARLTD